MSFPPHFSLSLILFTLVLLPLTTCSPSCPPTNLVSHDVEGMQWLELEEKPAMRLTIIR